MRTILIALALIISVLAAEDEPDQYMEEFMSGFDVGYFWRNTPEKLKEVDCPGPTEDKMYATV